MEATTILLSLAGLVSGLAVAWLCMRQLQVRPIACKVDKRPACLPTGERARR